ncbi:dynein axonemal heavy chain 12-like [Schistocerca serialis cubense]|uniref:dynein axonemal heavy chain 12-like n=1 Tax=Schistocerca serialis cubense TaxID=2023355 RepID=UPI00214E7941|nr:dynein axonemal heavy chain 12-like [Schistocerca serialis cubense]
MEKLWNRHIGTGISRDYSVQNYAQALIQFTHFGPGCDRICRVCQWNVYKVVFFLVSSSYVSTAAIGSYCPVICEVFEKLAQQAAVTPKTSEDLIEMSKYMLYASTTMLNELKYRINEQLAKLSHLLDMSFISAEHKDQNAVTVSWVARIDPIFRGNAVMIEECKFKFEELILKTTESVHKRLDDLEPKLALLDHMVEADHVEEYVSIMRVFLGKLAELKHDIKWINKEEKLFQFALSKYSNNEEFNIIINPFAHLLFTIYLWQLKHKVWMDGQFKRLHYEEVVSSISDFCCKY